MNKSLLVTRPKYDEGTQYLWAYSKEVIKSAQRRSFTIKDISIHFPFGLVTIVLLNH